MGRSGTHCGAGHAGVVRSCGDVPPFYYFEVGEQFFKALAELSIIPPDEADCLRLYARQIAQALLDGTLSASDACYRLYPIYIETHESEYSVWSSLCWAWRDIVDEGISRYYYDFELTLANFDDYARLEARKFLSEL